MFNPNTISRYGIRLFSVGRHISSTVPQYRMKASFRCLKEDREEFAQSKAQVTVSVGQDIHEGVKFESTMQLVNESFEFCVIMLDDTIQRYSLALDSRKKPNDFLVEAKSLGDEWLERNRAAYSNLEIPLKIVRWDDFRLRPDFSSTYLRMQQFYDHNSAFFDAVNNNAKQFLDRYEKRVLSPEYDRGKAYALCVQYLIEENAGMVLWPEMGCHFEVYPSGRNPSMQVTYDKLIAPDQPQLLRQVSLRFNKRNIEEKSPEKKRVDSVVGEASSPLTASAMKLTAGV